MIESRLPSSDAFRRVHEFLVAGANDELTERQWLSFEQFLDEDEDACRLYAQYVGVSLLLPSVLAEVSTEAASDPDDLRSEPMSPIPSIVSQIAEVPFHGFVDYVSSAWPVAYMVATVIFAIGLLVGAHIYVSQPTLMVDRSPPTRKVMPAPGAKAQVVGRITGMVDCKWAEPQTEAICGADVPLRRKYALSSGLMEITYGTGAKVILQGPAEYEVKSNNGGFLSIGKLTGKMEVETAKGFVVRTPSVTITDLGTEFGVEVSRKGVTETHVFVGAVSVQAVGQSGDTCQRTLHAGEAVQVVAGAPMGQVLTGSDKPFVRDISTATSKVQREPAGGPQPELINQVDYSDTWSANSPTRAGNNLPLTDPSSLRVEECFGNPQRSWAFSEPSAVTTWPADNLPTPWPGFTVRGSKSGFTESRWEECYFGLEYGLRDDFIAQFDAVQTSDRVNITISDSAATFGGPKSLSVFFRAAATGYPEIGLYAQGTEFNTGLRSGIAAPYQWHNYAVRFNLRKKKLTVWVDRRCLGTVDLATVTLGMTNGSWADLSLTNRFVNVGGHARSDGGPNRAEAGCVWTDNFRVGSPADDSKLRSALPRSKE